MKKVYLLPNLMTTACLFAGASSIRMALEGQYVMAGWLILVAGICDSLDGRLARLTKSESAFGVQYDSLSDMVSFGVAPAVMIYSWGLHGYGRLGSVIAFLFVACAALRLARFNVKSSRQEKNYFEGLSVPAAAGLLATWVIFYDHIFKAVPEKSFFIVFVTALLAMLMVSSLRYPSFKALDFRSRRSFHYLVGGVAALVVIAIEPRIVLFSGFVLYAVYGLFDGLFSLLKRIASSPPEEEKTEIHVESKKKSGQVHLLHVNRRATRADKKD